jgi:hypothetical protein
MRRVGWLLFGIIICLEPFGRLISHFAEVPEPFFDGGSSSIIRNRRLSFVGKKKKEERYQELKK